MDKSIIDDNTGEIIDFRPECPFRSITDLKGYKDDEVYHEPSLTDSGQFEPLVNIVARCMRGEIIQSNGESFYEFDGNVDESVLDADFVVDDLTAIDDKAITIADKINKKHVVDENVEQLQEVAPVEDENG